MLECNVDVLVFLERAEEASRETIVVVSVLCAAKKGAFRNTHGRARYHVLRPVRRRGYERHVVSTPGRAVVPFCGCRKWRFRGCRILPESAVFCRKTPFCAGKRRFLPENAFFCREAPRIMQNRIAFFCRAGRPGCASSMPIQPFLKNLAVCLICSLLLREPLCPMPLCGKAYSHPHIVGSSFLIS